MVAILVAIMIIPGTIWAFASSVDSTYLARTVAWGSPTLGIVRRFQRASYRTLHPCSISRKRPAPELFQSISYNSDGDQQQASLDELNSSNDTTSFLVLKDDVILYEGYFNGYQRDSIVTSFSMAKSVTSALIGIAIDEGYIGSVHDPIIGYLPEMKGRGYDQMTQS